LTLLTLILLCGVYALIDGVIAIVSAIKGNAPAARWWLAIVGILGIAVGALTFIVPGMTALILLFAIGGWAVTIGVIQVIGAIRLRQEIDNEWLLILSGVISVLFGAGLTVQPGVGTYAIIVGVLYIGLALRLKKYA
jgi:uncharacterized membrane protein HdeD (DUF308 family)